MKASGVLLALVLFFSSFGHAQTGTTLIPASTAWKYNDSGYDFGSAWQQPDFCDANWKEGDAQLGYGDGDETTSIGYGPAADNKHITSWFRKTFQVGDADAISSLTLQLLRDDGAVVYLNGQEVYRSNMPAGAVSYRTLATYAVGDAEENAWLTSVISKSALVSGTNVLAVEIHQANASSSDISFDLQLTSASDIGLLRGPYLQLGTPTSVYLKWRTDAATDSKVQYGTSPTSLNLMVNSATAKTDHEIQLTGLQPNTKYYYSVGTGTQKLQGDETNFFITAPAAGSVKKTRIWVIGDAGSNYAEQNQVRDAYYAYTGSTYTDAWLWLGDNAYQNGTDTEYQTAVFSNHYERMLKQTVAWPAPGNHDFANSGYLSPVSQASNFAYFDIFKLPTQAEAGGVASGTENYYSFNYSNIHFVSLDSYGSYNHSTSAMVNWLKNDLAANTLPWTVVYFHHPPYTKGSHDSDTETELLDMRANLVPVFEQYRVDLVLSGHSHSYERSYLIKGHMGLADSFTDAMKVDGGSGKLPEPYLKTSPEYAGTVYSVAGCSGKLSGISPGWPHKAMFYSTNTKVGSLVIDVDGNSLTVKFVDKDVNVADEFTIRKETANPMTSVPPGPAHKGLVMGTRDDDPFAGQVLTVFPNPSQQQGRIRYQLANEANVRLEVFTASGARVQTLVPGIRQKAGQYDYIFTRNATPRGCTYLVQLTVGDKIHTRKMQVLP